MKKLNKTVLLAAVLASAANAGLSISGDATVGLKYYTKNPTANNDNTFVVEGGNQNSGQTHINFAATEGGKSGKGAYAFVETLSDFALKSNNDFAIGNAYVGYNANKFDVRMGTLDALTYQWVGSLNEQMRFSSNTSIAPVSSQNNSNSIQFLTKLGTVTLGAGAQLDNQNYDYKSYDLGAKFDIGKLGFALVHQEANDGLHATLKYAHRNTTSASLQYAFKNLSSAKMLKDLKLSATYADYSEQTTLTSGRQTEDSTYSIGLNMNNTSLLYQKGVDYNRESYNFAHVRPISKNAEFGVEAQFGTKNYYATASNATASSSSRDSEFLVAYLSMNF